MRLTTHKVLFYITIFLAAFCTLTVLPDFRIELGSANHLAWNGLSSLGLSANLFNFPLGHDLYSDTRVSLQAERAELEPQIYDNYFSQDTDLIALRLGLVNQVLNARYVQRTDTDTGDKSVLFDFPAYVTDAENVAVDLTQKGELQIVSPGGSVDASSYPIVSAYFPDYQVRELSIGKNDITGLSVGPSDIAPIVLRTDFSDEVLTELQLAFLEAEYDPQTGEPTAPVLILVDGFPKFWAFHPTMFSNTGSTDFPNQIVWIPMFASDRLTVSVNTAVALGPELNLSYTNSGAENLSAIIDSDAGRWLLPLLAALMTLLWLSSARGRDTKILAYYAIVLGSTLVMMISIAKLVNIALDVPMVITFVLFSIFVGQLSLKAADAGLEQLAGHITDQTWLALLLFLILTIIYQFPLVNLNRAYEVLAVLSLGWVVSAQLFQRGVWHIYLEQND